MDNFISSKQNNKFSIKVLLEMNLPAGGRRHWEQCRPMDGHEVSGGPTWGRADAVLPLELG